jgi:hypothetical protein
MKRPSSKLFALIKKMTKEEKQYFSRFIYFEKKDAKNSLLYKIFCEIDSMKEYDEQRIKEWLASKLKGASFKTYKSLLKEKIMQSLSVQGNYISERTSYRKKAEYAEILAAKDLEEDALEILQNIKEVQLPEFHITSLVSNAERVISEIWMNINSYNNNENTAQLGEEGIRIASELHSSFIAFTHSKQLTSLATNSLLMQEKHEQQAFVKIGSEFERSIVIYSDDEPLFVTEGRVAKALIECEYEEAYTYSFSLFKRYYDLYHSFQKSKKNDHIFLGKLLYVAISNVVLTGKKSELFYIVGKASFAYEKFPGKEEQQFYYPVYLYGKLINSFWKTSKKSTETILEQIANLELWHQQSPNLTLYRTLATWSAIVHHSHENYTKSLSWVRKVLTTNPKDKTQNQYVEFCRLFVFIIEYDMEGISSKSLSKSFSLSVESTWEYLRKHDYANRSFTGIFLLYFKQITEFPREQKRQESFLKLERDFEYLKNTSTAKYFNSLFNFNAWVEKLKSELICQVFS